MENKCNQTNSYKNINFVLFEIIFLLLLNKIGAIYLIEINVNKIGYNQIFSDEYTGTMPDRIIFNERPLLIIDKIIYVQSLDNSIRLEWDNYFNNFTFMFSNLTSITHINMNFELQNNCNMSYMFYNCYNLKEFNYGISSVKSLTRIDMSKMFYNCSLLHTFKFNQLNLFNANTSYMFFNCQSLNSINFNSNIETNDMKGMFYNCISLENLNLANIKTNNYYIDVSYMFYNCYKMNNFIGPSGSIIIKEMKYMFYNCSSLNKVDFNYFKGASNSYINMSYLFYNCSNLEKIEGSFGNLYVSDASKMFYNCSSL